MADTFVHFDLDGKRYLGKIEDLLVKPIAYCITPANDFTVAPATPFVVPFTVNYFDPEPTICEVKLADNLGDFEFYIKPLVPGFYHVDGLFRDTGMVIPNAAILYVGGGDGSQPISYCTAPPFRFNGSRIVYCDGENDQIVLQIEQNTAGPQVFNRVTVPGANGFISVHFCGFPKAATV